MRITPASSWTSIALALLTLALVSCDTSKTEDGKPAGATDAKSGQRLPNIVLIISDDLGVGELGCYGQKIIQTPNIDALAARGVRFAEAYSGSCVCAPSRCSLLTGFHTGHSAIRDNKELSPEGQQPLPPESLTIASLLSARGYATAAIGKWGLGPPGSSGDPAKHGFDLFFGYLCQRHAQNHYPGFLYRNNARVELSGNQDHPTRGETSGGIYAPDLFRDEALKFISDNRAKPFFLLFATPVPHLALQVPEDSLAQYKGKIADAPYDGSKGYLPHETPHAAYAAMVSRMDRDVGQLLAKLEQLGLADNTLVIFTSDNGASYTGGTDSTFFESAAGRRGLKGQLYEGGIRVPLIVSWPGKVRQGALSAAVTGNWDLFPTIAAFVGLEPGALPKALDGIDLSPQLLRDAPLAARDHLYWEYAAGGGWQAARIGTFKGVRRNAKKNPVAAIEVYDLSTDPGEKHDIAAEHPELVERLGAVMAARTPALLAEWNFAK